MIKVLIVDDDNLVRKGLISILPWKENGMEVVGEAKNGEKALEFLAMNKVDLLFTDLAMPVMSGMELMRIVRKQYPHVFIVVLTLHQDFEYIQESLRLGAIDYIAKVEMEDEHFGEVMSRVKGRIQEEQSKHAAPAASNELSGIRSTRGLALTRFRPDNDEGRAIRESIAFEVPPVELEPDLLLWLPSDNTEESLIEGRLVEYVKRHPEWVMIRAGGLEGRGKHEIYQFLRQYTELELFYEAEPKLQLYDVAIVKELDHSASVDKLSELKKTGLPEGWVQRASEFERFLEALKDARLPPAKLMAFLHSQLMVWDRIYYSVTQKQLVWPDNLHTWFEAMEWLSAVRELLIGAIGKGQYSEEVRACITTAVRGMHDELSGSVHAAEMAKRVNMSRSYFSQCFKDLVGMTFNDYLRHIRMEKAKEYLQYTQKTVQWIAENTGYMDHKYFSRVFLEKTNMLPSEYRQYIQAELQMSEN